jgi:hypothetical protein
MKRFKDLKIGQSFDFTGGDYISSGCVAPRSALASIRMSAE